MSLPVCRLESIRIQRLKCLKSLDGKAATRMASQNALEARTDYTVSPITLARLDESGNGAFFLADFISLQARCSAIARFLHILKILHQSPTSQSGVLVSCHNILCASPIRNERIDTWEEVFTPEFRSNLQ